MIPCSKVIKDGLLSTTLLLLMHLLIHVATYDVDVPASCC
jgi:hypothetical protein